jgi:hypothetical protein
MGLRSVPIKEGVEEMNNQLPKEMSERKDDRRGLVNYHIVIEDLAFNFLDLHPQLRHKDACSLSIDLLRNVKCLLVNEHGCRES